MVMSDQEWKQEQKPRAPDGFVVWLSSLSLSLSLSLSGWLETCRSPEVSDALFPRARA
jgi:hypothetical protein